MPPDLAAFRGSHADLFGSVPPPPEAQFEFSGAVAPELLRLAGRLRAHAFSSEVLDVKTTQLMRFGMLLVLGHGAARFHAVAARRAGATWEELHKVAELASAAAALGPLNGGSGLLNDLCAHEREDARRTSGGAPVGGT